ncbi:disulfide bond formation protein DsbA [Bifidobacterium aemilianum]|uniref:Disulfide bond formation protein DsbA n=1 Tax=Bifidobacterium aemilianum TaxID=2493120 RepID=A0A366KA56_9BIFI|nr:thioredoxin domain-containing protein [Bifidobacterium aemilianum]RBP98003.1 disulfide bond formation protein DsbA [Bifidobacterium aemilianum]
MALADESGNRQSPADIRPQDPAQQGRGQAPLPDAPECRASFRVQPRALMLILSVVIVLALVLGALFYAFGSSRNNAARPTSGPSATAKPGPAPAAPKPLDNEAYRALQAVQVRPDKADAQGGFIVGRQGVGKPTAKVPTIDIYMDFLCPPCGQLHQILDPTLMALVDAGQANVGIHFMSFLDSHRPDQYSSRTASMAATVAQEAPDCFLPLVEALYAKDFQPSEESQDPISNETLAQVALKVGVPQEVADHAVQGQYLDWVQKLTDYTKTRPDLEHPSGQFKGQMTTPTLIINNSYFPVGELGSNSDGKSALCKAIGLQPAKLGDPSAQPSIGADRTFFPL